MFRRYISCSVVIAASAVLSMGCGPSDAEQSVDTLGTSNQALSAALFYHEFRADNGVVNSQCNNGINIYESKHLGEWTTRFKLDTDSRAGGCLQTFGISDPQGELSGLSISVDFHGEDNFTGNAQCDYPGIRWIVPTTSTTPSGVGPWGIDTDQRSRGCVQAFSLLGRSDVALDVKFEDENYNGQCKNTGLHTITSTRSASIIMDMDDRRGGCFQSFRLRMMSCGDNICDPNESCEADCVFCGDGICNGTETELSCMLDCGSSSGVCGDGICEGIENELNCPEDCGSVTCLRPPPGCL
jgi:hypothetical protein